MSQRIVVTGAGGRMGAALVRQWKAAKEDVIGFTHADLDIGSSKRLHQVLDNLDFGVLVNCAAQTSVDEAEKHPEEALHINAQAVRELAEICDRKRARCIHFSSDYVFSGTKTSPYSEEDSAEPVSRYGESKLAGEFALLGVSDLNLAVRVSWVFGPDRPSFIDQILERARTKTTVAAVHDKIAVPTYTLDAAQLLRPFLFEKKVGGVLHLCNAGDCTWQEYAQHAIDCAVATGEVLKTQTVQALKMTDIKAFVARRPPYSVMSTAKLANLIGRKPRDWRDAVREYVASR